MVSSSDIRTAQAFANSWNNLPRGSVYTFEDFEDWLHPLTEGDLRGRSVLELGCGNASLLYHMTRWFPSAIIGVDLGDSVRTARENLELSRFGKFEVHQADLVTYRGEPCDVVYCVGVLHHLKNPHAGFQSVVSNTKEGGAFHCWVYGKEGNRVVILLVEPLRRLCSMLPWWFTKYAIATPLAIPFYLYANTVAELGRVSRFARKLPLYEYCEWIAKRPFSFFRHVAFDQLVTPQTTYVDRATIEKWLSTDPRIDPKSAYIMMRNGNSWKFGGRRVEKAD